MSRFLPSPGRIFYLCYHQPLAEMRALIREGGPRQRRLTLEGRIAMEAAATRLPALPIPPAGAPDIHLLTGRTLWFQTAFLLTSLAPHVVFRPVIHDDGTLRDEALAQLQRIAPGGRFVLAAENRERLDAYLPESRFPGLHRRRQAFVVFRKLTDVHVGAKGWNLFLDSDQLFFRAPAQLTSWLQAPDVPLHMTDVADAYGCPLPMLETLAGGPVPRRVNTGILGLQSDRLDWERLEWFCRELDARLKPHYFHEQAIIAFHLAIGTRCIALPSTDYVVLPQPPETGTRKAVCHHYVAESKRWYYQDNWRLFARDP